MSKQPMGKTLLRNVIRHTDAHNKIQEETEMWKTRDLEIRMSHHKDFPDKGSMRGHMHCDRVPDRSRDTSQSRERGSEHYDREARYWTRKLYEFEASDPDRWGHSGFKELYPEEFESGGEESGSLTKSECHKVKKSKSDRELSKRSKKSRKKKKKKKRKSENRKRKKDESSSSDLSSDDSSAGKDKQRKRKRTKSRHKNKKTAKTRGREEDSSSGDGNDEERRVRHNHSRKRQKQDPHTDSGPDSRKKRRRNWKAADEGSSDSSAD